ncbi:hypothetical protein GGQ68_000441 [Sagittula marina]|uniref:Uncharacterized protein n=1 Tax=Sagittula marina TaxID=943940 RepID=A0A7W6DJ03_9RHOB|nr:hypothetical protein [Sagittula marina]MBB3984130.1 hypothetical protein [Sagittula marina]
MKTRFIKSIVATAKANETTRMPWERGTARSTMIASRKAPTPSSLKRA